VPVAGYGEVRYPKLDAARAAVEVALAPVPTCEVGVRRGVLESMGRTTTSV
jgi:hypothetical protein